MKVLVALGRDAVLTQTLDPQSVEPREIGKRVKAPQSAAESSGGGVQGRGRMMGMEKGTEDEDWRWTSEEEVVQDGDLRGSGRLEDLQRAMHDTLNMATSECATYPALQAAAGAIELSYWTSRLSFAITSTSSSISSIPGHLESRVALALDDIRRGVVSAQAWLRHGDRRDILARGDTGGVEENSASGVIMEALKCFLLSVRADAKDDGMGNACSKEDESAERYASNDAAEEVVVWWWGRAYVWAVMLESIASRSRAPTANASKQHPQCMCAVEWAHVLSQSLQLLSDIQHLIETAAEREREENSAGGGHALGGGDGRHLCRSSVAPFARAAVCAEWLHLACFAPDGMLKTQQVC